MLSAFPSGTEFPVNDLASVSPSQTAVASNAQGDVVIAWAGFVTGQTRDIFARRYNAAGVPQGGAFHVNSLTTGQQEQPSVAIDADGDFVVAWRGYNEPNGGISFRRFDATGTPQGDQIGVIESTGPFYERDPSVGMGCEWRIRHCVDVPLGDGDGNAVRARAYDASGTAAGPIFRVNDVSTGAQLAPSVAVGADGSFVIAFNSPDGNPYGVYARRFNPAGQPYGTEFRVNTYTTNGQGGASIGMDASGDFIISWTSVGQDGSDAGIFTQRFTAAGVPVGTEFRVNTYTTGPQRFSAVASSTTGEFVITWEGEGRAGYGVYAQRYTASGVPDGGEFRVNTSTPGSPTSPSAAMDGNGDFLITWVGSNSRLLAQRYRLLDAGEIATAGDRVWRDLDGDGIQEPGEPGLTGASVELYAASGVMASSATTDIAGQFGFLVPAGEAVYLRFITPSDVIPTRQNQGSDDQRDSDADRVTGLVPPFTLTEPGAIDSSIDAGFLGPSSIAGVMFSDRNGNGARDAGEPPVPGFVVFIDQNGDETRQPGEPFAISDNDGKYAFTNLLPDTYRLVIEDQELWVEPGAINIVLAPETAVSDLDRPLRTSVPDSAAVPVGPQFRVNAPTTSWAREPAVAVDPDGDFVVAWVHFFYSPSSIRAQRFNAAGVPQGDEFVVTSTGVGVAFGPTAAPSVAMDADGDFVIVWPSYQTDGSSLGVRARRYDAGGVPQGGEFRVNTYTTGAQWDSSVAMSDDGDFVVAWTSNVQDGSVYGVFAQRFDAGGTRQGSEFRVNSYTTGDQSQPSVAIDADGDFVVAWAGAGPGYDDEIWGRRFLASGQPLGDETRVSTNTGTYPEYPSVATDFDGDFVVAWRETTSIRVQRFSASGVPRGAAVPANTSRVGHDGGTSVAMDDDGDFVVVWQNYYTQFSPTTVFSRRYSAAGVPQGGEIRVSTITANRQFEPSVALDADGDFVVTWSAAASAFSTYGTYAQRYAVVPEVLSSSFLFDSSPHRLRFRFNHDVRDSLSVEDLLVQNLTTGQTIPSNQFVLLYDDDSDVATFMYLGSGSDAIGGVLPDGNYRATLLASGISTPQGASLAADHEFEFFFLNGDASRDGRVTLPDFNILAANFGQSGTDFTRGDFTYDGQTDLGDFNLLAARFGIALPPVTSSGIGVADVLLALPQDDDDVDWLTSLLAK